MITMRFNPRFLFSGLVVTCLFSFSPKTDACYAIVIDRVPEPSSFKHYLTSDDVDGVFLEHACKIGDILVLIDWSSFRFNKEDWGFIERGVSSLTESEWQKISELLNLNDPKSIAEKEEWLILEAVSSKK